jgi:hypothetical protein
MPKQPRWKYPGVIEYHQVRAPQQCRKLREQAVFERVASQVQHSGSRPLRWRVLRNQLRGQEEIKIGNQHGNIIVSAKDWLAIHVKCGKIG